MQNQGEKIRYERKDNFYYLSNISLMSKDKDNLYFSCAWEYYQQNDRIIGADRVGVFQFAENDGVISPDFFLFAKPVSMVSIDNYIFHHNRIIVPRPPKGRYIYVFVPYIMVETVDDVQPCGILHSEMSRMTVSYVEKFVIEYEVREITSINKPQRNRLVDFLYKENKTPEGFQITVSADCFILHGMLYIYCSKTKVNIDFPTVFPDSETVKILKTSDLKSTLVSSEDIELCFSNAYTAANYYTILRR